MRAKHGKLRQPQCRLAVVSRGSPWISAYTLYFQKLESMAYILPLIVWLYRHSNFSGGFRNTIFFPPECVSAVQGHSRSLTLSTGRLWGNVCNGYWALLDLCLVADNGTQATVLLPLSSVLCCRLHLPPGILVTCCPLFILYTSLIYIPPPGVLWSCFTSLAFRRVFFEIKIW